MESFCLSAGKLGHSLGGAPCRSGKLYRRVAVFKKRYYRVKGCRFSGSRSAGKNKHTAFKRLFYCLTLELLEFYSELVFNPVYFEVVNPDRAVDMLPDRSEPGGDMLLRRAVFGKRQKLGAGYEYSRYRKAAYQNIDYIVYTRDIAFEQSRSYRRKLFSRQAGMTVHKIFPQNIFNSGAQPHFVIRRYFKAFGYLFGAFKAEADILPAENIRIFLYFLRCRRAERAVNLNANLRRNIIGRQHQHNIPYSELLFVFKGNIKRFFKRNPLN